MNVAKAVIALATLGLAVPASAALPPIYQRAVEMKAILDSSDVVGGFKGVDYADSIIEKVEYVSPDLYRVSTRLCTMDVKIVDKPSKPSSTPIVGPRQFTVAPEKAVCRSE